MAGLHRPRPRRDELGGLQAARIAADGSSLSKQRGFGEPETLRRHVVHRLGVDAADERPDPEETPDPAHRHREAGRLQVLSMVSAPAAFFCLRRPWC